MLSRFTATLILFFALTTLEAAVEPKHEYERPGFKPGHAYDSIIPEENINLFTGGLSISQHDVPVKNYKAFEEFQQLISRYYSSKIFRQAQSPTCNDAAAMGTTIEDEFVGLGWTLHFGRLWDWGSGPPVLELPDGTRHTFYSDTFNTGRMISKSLWILQSGFDSGEQAEFIDITSPANPDTVTIRFYNYPDNRYEDLRGQRIAIHAARWTNYCSGNPNCLTGTSTVIEYARDNAQLLWPKRIEQPCENNVQTPRYVVFNWNTTSVKPTLDSITFPWIGGTTLTYTYTYTLGANGHMLLESFSTQQGKTYRYSYDNATNELTKIQISADATVDSSDLTIEYVYETKAFDINLFSLSAACSRVVKEKRMNKPGGLFDLWTYTYSPPDGNDNTPQKVTVIEPRGHKRDVSFRGYAINSSESANIWKVGNLLEDETFQNNSGNFISLKKNIFTYGDVVLSNAGEIEVGGVVNVRLPILLTSTELYPQTSQQATKTFLNYDRFGNVGEIQERNFSNVLFRKTQYQYEHSNSDGDETSFEDNNFVRATSLVKVFNGVNQVASEIKYDYYNTLTEDGRFGLLKVAQTWDSETGTFIDKNFDYNGIREVSQIGDEQNVGGDRNTYFNNSCNVIDRVIDDLELQAGPIFFGQIWPGEDQEDWNWVFKEIHSPNGNVTSFTYDADQRVTLITPPTGDVTNINYNDTSRQVTVTQGLASTIEDYDNRGQLSQRQVSISSGQTSKQTFAYDAVGNLTSESEKTLSPTPSTFVNRTYDALNRLTSVATADGTVTYTFNGPDVTVSQQNESGGVLSTVMKYDSAGRLISVTEPNSTRTSYAYDELDRLTMVCHNDNDDVCDIGSSLRRTFGYSTRGKLLFEKHPEFRNSSNPLDYGETTYKYDLLGRVIEKKFTGMTTPITNTYDLRDRVTSIHYPNDPAVFFYYDGTTIPGYPQTYVNALSHLTGVIDSTGATLWHQFSPLENVEKKRVNLMGLSQINIEYHYDSRGNLDSVTYPSGNKITIPRNNANAISQVKRQFGFNPETFLIDAIGYNAALLPSSIEYSNNVDLTITPDVRNRPDVISSAGKLTLDYGYNVRSLISQIITSQNGSPQQARDITYDNLGRVSTFSHSGNPTLNYSFDIYGNFLQKTGALSEGPYSYTNNRIDGITYSPAGSQLTANGNTLAYDDENRLKIVTGASGTTTYTYDGLGNRVKSSKLDAETRYFIYDENKTLLAEVEAESGTNEINKEYVNGPTGTLVTINYEDMVRDFIVDDLMEGTRLRWKNVSSCRVVGFNVYRSSTPGSFGTPLNTGGPVTTGSFLDTTAPECDLFYYIVRPVYNDGTLGPSSVEVAHRRFNEPPVANLVNTPSSGFTPLTVTFNYSGLDSCGTVVGYRIDFGDNDQFFVSTAAGSTQYTYTTASTCYPFCIATLTVTDDDGAQAIYSVLTDMSNNLILDENFDDGVANGFTPSTGSWSVVSGLYTGQSGTPWAITRSPVTAGTGVFRFDARVFQMTGPKGAYAVFDYVDANNFKYAGIDVMNDEWAIGDVIGGSQQHRARFSQNLNTGVWYALEVRFDSVSKVVHLKGNGVTKVIHTFSTLNSSVLGFAVRSGKTDFDNIRIAQGINIDQLHEEDFNDGIAQNYTNVNGNWTMLPGKYQGDAPTSPVHAVSLTPVSTFNDGVIKADLKASLRRGWVIFDYQNLQNYKYAGLDANLDLWIIGDVVSGNRTNRATAPQPLNENTVYPITVLLEASNTVTLIYQNQVKIRWTFASLTPRSVGIGTHNNSTCEFDNIVIYRESFGSGFPPTVPPPSEVDAPADGPFTDYTNAPIYYHLNDHLGTTRILTNETGGFVGSFEYYPFGEVKSIQGCAVDGQRFTGKLFDNESGLQYFGARYLSNALTRFTSVDPSRGSFDKTNPQTWNRYAYSLSSPLDLIDPDGKDVILVLRNNSGGGATNFGHTALRVVGNGYDRTYDFGRYGHASGFLSYKGEGILRVWNNYDTFASRQKASGDLKTLQYKTSKQTDEAVMAFFGEKIKGGTKRKGGKAYDEYKLKEDYHLVDNNCTTICLDAMGAAKSKTGETFPGYDKFKDEYDPRALYEDAGKEREKAEAQKENKKQPQ
jgi:RHS repeat-associated protein